MAVWEFQVALEPNALPSGSNGPPSEPDRGGALRCEDADILGKIDRMLPRRESWSKDLILWGEENGNRLHAALEGGKIVELTARIDLRQPPGSFPSQLVELARDCGVQFSTADGERIPPDIRSLSDAVRRSRAFRFVLDPHHYFSEPASNPVV